MKKFNVAGVKFGLVDVAFGVIFFSVMVGSIIWFAKTPAKDDPACTTEYVNINGTEDCERNTKADSDASLERMNDQYR